MEVLDGRGNLEKVELGGRLIEPGLLDDLVKQFPALRQLQDYVEVVGSVDHVLQLDNTRMVDRLQDFNFVQDPFHDRVTVTRDNLKCHVNLLILGGAAGTGEGAVSSLGDHLDGDPVKVRDPEGQSHLATDASPQQLAHFVLGGELLGVGILHNFVTHEDEDLLGGVGEADHRVVLQRPDVVLPNFVTVNPGSLRRL